MQLSVVSLGSTPSVLPQSVYSLIFCLLLAIVIRSWCLRKEGKRVDAAVQARMGKLICRDYDPLGGGWAARRSRRIYRIVYQDPEGHTHQVRASVVAAYWVRFYDDVIIGWHLPPDSVPRVDRVAELDG